MSQILKEIQAIKKCIAGKKEKFQKSHVNFVELNKILGRSIEHTKPNLLLELTAHEIISDLKFLEIIGEIFKVELEEFVKTINNDFKTNSMPLEIEGLDIENVKKGEKFTSKIGKSCNELLPHIQKLTEKPWRGRMFPVPEESYYVYLYGKDWRIPRKTKDQNV